MTSPTLVERLEALCSDAVTGVPDTAIFAMLDAAARIRVLEEALATILHLADEAPDAMMCDQVDNYGEWYQSAAMARALVAARALSTDTDQ